ncbi:MAG TPA: ABC transporter permease [Vicinamibacterales bacterium]|nr:ABC transporter permease [Vicinamibacterales bacterium]
MPAASSVVHDLRYAIRLLRNSRGFAAVAIATIALAVGANSAMFSFVNGLLLRPLPYPESDRIVRVLERAPAGALNAISTLNYLDWTNQNRVFEFMAAEAGWPVTLTGAGEPLVIRGARASVHYFDIFGVTAAMGRTFRPGEDQPGSDRVVLLSHLLWDSRFGSDPALVGRNILLNGESHTVVGILQKGSPFDRAAVQIWKPLAFQPSNMSRDFRWLGASARLKPGVTLEEARAEMRVIAQRLADAYPGSNTGWGVAVDPLASVLVGPQLRTAATVLFAATLFVLLIGCANLANLALARSVSREGEIAVRAALGASRWRLVRQLLIEHVAIAAWGGIVGIAVGYAILKWIRSLIPPFALPPAVDIGFDASVLLFTLAAVLLTGLLFGAAPAALTTKPSLGSVYASSGHRTTPGRLGRHVRAVLVVAEIALAFVLLVASGLLMRSFLELLDIDPGFDSTNVLTAGLPITRGQHPDPVELNAYLASISAALEAVPGVRETALTSALPLQGWGYGVPYSIAGRAPMDRIDRRPAFFKIVSPSYFDALRIKLLAGRVLSDTDLPGGLPVAVINETLARREFPGEDPIGRRILVREIVPGTTDFGRQIAWEIVGVIAGEKITGLGDEISAGMYVSNQQSPTYAVNLIVRAGMSPQSLHRAVRSAVAGVNPDQALSDVRTLAEIVDQSMLANRVTSTIVAVFASIALLLAGVGIYGVIACTAAQRTREMGIRAALGASAGSLRRLIVQRGMRLTVIGLLIGLVGTDAATRVMSSMLYGVEHDDPLTMVVVAAVLFGVAGLACVLPAWRMTNVDPMEALRHE